MSAPIIVNQPSASTSLIQQTHHQSEMSKVVNCILSPITFFPIYVWNDCVRRCCCFANNYPSIGIIQDTFMGSESKLLSEDWWFCPFYTQRETYSTTLCCMHYSSYDPCSN